jgi:Lar family restriction alleviation protein
MNVTHIHTDVPPPPVIIRTDLKLRQVYWRAAKDYAKAAKEERRSGRPGLASEIQASGRQAFEIATADDAMATLHRLVREAEPRDPGTYFVETYESKPLYGTPAPLPCPYCGDRDMVSITERAAPEDDQGPSYYAECQGCGAEGPSGSTQLEAARAWNTRPNSGQEAGQ